MVASKAIKDDDSGLIQTKNPDVRLLPSAVIYGANASGKTNLVKAFRFMRHAIHYSHSKGDPNGGVPRIHFKLGEGFEAKSSKFDVDFLVNGVRHHYGFTANNDRFLSEWLYSFSSNRSVKLFERKLDKFYPSESGRLKGRNKTIFALTRPNSLYLSTAVQNNHEQLSAVARYLNKAITFNVIFGDSVSIRPDEGDESFDPRIIKFLGAVGTGIVDSRFSETKIPESVRNINNKIRTMINQERPEGAPSLDEMPEKVREVKYGHRGEKRKVFFLDEDEQSAGTKRLVPLLMTAFEALDSGSLVIVDELEANLHTHAAEAVLELFSSKKTNPKGAQLIATTHDTNLLKADFLRRDQIWFTKKDSEGATEIYPLTDFRSRKDDNIAKGYLQGRYDAVPDMDDITDLLTVS